MITSAGDEKLSMERSKNSCWPLIFTVVCYLAFVVAIFVDREPYMRLTALSTLLCATIMVLLQLPCAGRYKIPVLLLSGAFVFWIIPDIARLLVILQNGTDELSTTVRSLYVVTNYLFAAAILSYYFLRMNKLEIFRAVMDTLVLSVISFLIARKGLQYLTDGSFRGTDAYRRALFYAFINLIVIFLILTLFHVKGLRGVRRSLMFLPAGMLAYAVLDLRYTYMEAIGMEAESRFADLFYILFIVMMAVGVWNYGRRKEDLPEVHHEFTADSVRNRQIMILVLMALSVLLSASGILSREELFYLVIVLLAYLIMVYSLRNSMLSGKMLEEQAGINRKLEEEVDRKTADLRQANEELGRLSSTDSLTGLRSRRYGEHALKLYEEGYQQNKTSYAVYCADLNRFKPINDTYGHDMGDRVLETLGERLNALPEDFLTVRVGGDEFMILRRDVAGREGARRDAARLKEIFSEPVLLDTYEFRLSAGIGIALCPEDGTDPYELMKYADVAMYEVKRSGEPDGYRFFDDELVAALERRERLVKRLRAAEPDLDFEIHYQIQVDAASKEIIGVEAFPRLRRAEEEQYSPAEIIPIAEELGTLNRLGGWIARTALEQLAHWRAATGRDLTMTINLAALQLLDVSFIESLRAQTDELGIPPHALILDISNEVMLGAASSAYEMLRRLREYGFTLSLNDFGGDDISLSYIMECGFSRIKLADRLVREAGEDKANDRLVRAMLALIREMDVTAQAICVETEEERERMLFLGVRIMQGYYFGKPAPAGRILDVLMPEVPSGKGL